MKVLVVRDDCGHTSVFDISDPEKEKKVLFGMAKGFLKHGSSNMSPDQIEERFGDLIRLAIDNNSPGELMEYLGEDFLNIDARHSELSIVKVEDEWDDFLNIYIG